MGRRLFRQSLAIRLQTVMAKKKLRLSPALKNRLNAKVRQGRRETLYKMTLKREGVVNCFVCQRHVKEHHATLEHVMPQSHGGSDEMDNLAISHVDCNKLRGNHLEGSAEFLVIRQQMAERFDRRLAGAAR
jgi:5-methylcytosine-specific restriction endonuclease McrA